MNKFTLSFYLIFLMFISGQAWAQSSNNPESTQSSSGHRLSPNDNNTSNPLIYETFNNVTITGNNVFVGNQAGDNNSGFFNSFVGSRAGRDNTKWI